MERQSKWPKVFPPLTPEQKWISDDFMKYWHEVLPARYGIVNSFNHGYAVRHAPPGFVRTLEIGCGDGEHLEYETLSDAQRKNYHAIDIRQNMVDALKQRFPDVNAHVSDCQARMPFEDGYFDRVLAIHVLEHLPNLPEAVKELHRLCDKERGVLSVVIPCEGGLAYGMARKISAERIFRKRYKQSYSWFIGREHINVPSEILAEITPYFEVESSSYFPIPAPAIFCNLCIGLTFKPRH
ncbi:class I SAM-dependent methyltransferase [Paraburkholderia dinghuensis]|uniref:Class I SAM-dependent methyltransferase n=1 Tax=Paraburkholderia dinghuensis TaxID=2305225 RepID=A0A3N6MU47_9BURK|nr:class I SAM-dependent methyltransferase [Paraburkholderia dinghuensis]RQG99811.1 class I SAM-dependent methyltransferase [Paraburkholderia dinghuensis]